MQALVGLQEPCARTLYIYIYIYIYIQHGESITNRQNCLLLKQTIEGEGQNTVNTYKYHIHTNRRNCLLLKQTIEGEGQNTVNQLHG